MGGLVCIPLFTSFRRFSFILDKRLNFLDVHRGLTLVPDGLGQNGCSSDMNGDTYIQVVPRRFHQGEWLYLLNKHSIIGELMWLTVSSIQMNIFCI